MEELLNLLNDCLSVTESIDSKLDAMNDERKASV